MVDVTLKLLLEFSLIIFHLDEFVDFGSEVFFAKLFAQSNDDSDTLREVQHVHVVENPLCFIFNDANPDCVTYEFVHVTFEVGNLRLVHD